MAVATEGVASAAAAENAACVFAAEGQHLQLLLWMQILRLKLRMLRLWLLMRWQLLQLLPAINSIGRLSC